MEFSLPERSWVDPAWMCSDILPDYRCVYKPRRSSLRGFTVQTVWVGESGDTRLSLCMVWIGGAGDFT